MKICPLVWEKPRTIFDIPALKAKIQDLEQVAAQPEFWDDQTTAQNTLQELNDLKSHLQQYQQWQNNLEDTRAIFELLELETDESLLEEAQATISGLNQELDRWELQQLLSGLYDQNGAVITINAGAGGTDAQDWAEMLLRMYTRWEKAITIRYSWQKFLREMKQVLSLQLWKLSGAMLTVI